MLHRCIHGCCELLDQKPANGNLQSKLSNPDQKEHIDFDWIGNWSVIPHASTSNIVHSNHYGQCQEWMMDELSAVGLC